MSINSGLVISLFINSLGLNPVRFSQAGSQAAPGAVRSGGATVDRSRTLEPCDEAMGMKADAHVTEADTAINMVSDFMGSVIIRIDEKCNCGVLINWMH